MIKDINTSENVDLKEIFNLDADVRSMVLFLQSEIAKAQASKVLCGEHISNYYTYTYSFENDRMVISGLVVEDKDVTVSLSEFIAELGRL